jgi:hypothetical protein
MRRSKTQFRTSMLLLSFTLCVCDLASLRANDKGPRWAAPRRRVEVADSIEMTRLGDRGSSPSGNTNVARFSPDGSHFALIVVKGNIKKSVNESSLLLFSSSGVFRSSKPEVLLTMSSSSNREAIRKLRWLSNDALCFIGENAGQSSQIYVFHIRTKEVQKLTNHSTSILNYEITTDVRTILFSADRREQRRKGTRHRTVTIDGTRLYDLLSGDYDEQQEPQGQQVFLKRENSPEQEIRIPSEYFVDGTFGSLSLSPDGRYGVIGVMLRQVRAEWADYHDEIISAILDGPPIAIGLTPITQALLYDDASNHLGPVPNGPVGLGHGNVSAAWGVDSRSLFIHSTWPIETADGAGEKSLKANRDFFFKVTLPDRRISMETDGEWPSEQTPLFPVKVEVKQDLNSPPKIIVSRMRMQQKSVVIDLNPQFTELDLGSAERIEWMVDAEARVEGGLYLPPDYSPGKRYPLVIQTHGFDHNRFSMDGLQDWSSAYAARAMAARGIIVLQAFNFVSPGRVKEGPDRPGRDDGSPEQTKRNMESAAYEKAIDYLDKRGLIDRNRVGIVGFSRTVCYVGYTLTHSRYHFAAASLVDGVDCGYFQAIAFPTSLWDIERMYGDALPFGPGLKEWLRNSPSFSLDQVNTPVSLLALRPEGVLVQWEWYAGLKLQGKPVAFTLVSDDNDDREGNNHLLVKPWEKKIAQEQLVDWFCFWLNGYEDSNPNKKDQYLRWEKLRK